MSLFQACGNGSTSEMTARGSGSGVAHDMNEVRKAGEMFEQAAQDKSLSSEHFLGLTQAIARAEKGLPIVAASEPDMRQGVDIVEKLGALVKRQGTMSEDSLYSDPQTMVELQALLPGLADMELREFLREFLHGLNRHRARPGDKLPTAPRAGGPPSGTTACFQPKSATAAGKRPAQWENAGNVPRAGTKSGVGHDVWLKVPVSPAGLCSADREALMALFRSTAGASWNRNKNWNMAAELSTWCGVEVNADERVVGLRLRENNLQGKIPAELGQLVKLKELNLDQNKLSGEIPASLGQLVKLETLGLYRNKLSGSIPPQLGELAALQYLSLSENQLTGPIPSELGHLSALQGLNLSGNQLSGTIPQVLGMLTALQWLLLSENQLSGHIPRQLGDLGALKTLDLGFNKLEGEIQAIRRDVCKPNISETLTAQFVLVEVELFQLDELS
ncbi:unnamed protein product [Ectocarpus sp. CCAP 1310/34]|nr:unnamed protein product [Ectocarpus sp. CCAP 1310/34]